MEKLIEFTTENDKTLFVRPNQIAGFKEHEANSFYIYMVGVEKGKLVKGNAYEFKKYFENLK